MIKYMLAIILSFSFCFAECVHEKTLKGSEIDFWISSVEDNKSLTFYVEVKGCFVSIEQAKIDADKTYVVQALPKKERDDYNKKYVTYYDYSRLNEFLENKNSDFSKAKYQKIKIGESLENRNLYAIVPNTIEHDKKTIIMFCRHHGDEGTANWIVEGFVNKVFSDKKWLHDFQLILYPMINPDGADKKTRYNINGRDLNRSWGGSASDEIIIIRKHLEFVLNQLDEKKVFSVLDMHGSFVEDFIYRVPRFFVDLNFFEMQGKFINQLAIHDVWQNGNFHLSEGSSGMSRIYLIKKYGFNALTHESIRNIPLNKGRSIDTLKEQGYAVYVSIKELGVLQSKK